MVQDFLHLQYSPRNNYLPVILKFSARLLMPLGVNSSGMLLGIVRKIAGHSSVTATILFEII